MNHCGTVLLETERLILRRFQLSDAPDFYKNVTSDPEVNRFLTWENDKSVADTEALMMDFIQRYEDPERYCWAIVMKESGEVIGTLAATNIRKNTRAVEVSYSIGKNWWGKGITAEALQKVMDFLFNQVGFNRIEAGYDVSNPNSGKVLEKVGMRREGLLRQAGRNNQGIYDRVIYAKLKSDE